jgi:hypothetical protein
MTGVEPGLAPQMTVFEGEERRVGVTTARDDRQSREALGGRDALRLEAASMGGVSALHSGGLNGNPLPS